MNQQLAEEQVKFTELVTRIVGKKNETDHISTRTL